MAALSCLPGNHFIGRGQTAHMAWAMATAATSEAPSLKAPQVAPSAAHISAVAQVPVVASATVRHYIGD